MPRPAPSAAPNPTDRDRRRTGAPVVPAEELLHPWPLVAVLVLVVNDRLLKGAGLAPAWLTGKLSDVAGLFFFPLLLTALARLGAWPFTHLARRARPPLPRWLLAAAIGATGAAFAAVQLWPWATRAWAAAVAALDVTGLFARVTVTPDPTDLLTLPALALTWWHGRRFVDRGARRGGAPG